MISPPEFHYRGATLTLPIIRVFGDGLAGGDISMSIKPREQARLVFPNRTAKADGDEIGAPYNETTTSPILPARNYTNAIRNGTVNITVRSQYSHGWETYFKERTTGRTERLGENTVRLTLETTTGAPGAFDMPDAGDSVFAGAIAGGHPLTDFETRLQIDKNKPHFSFYAEEGNKEFEIHVYSEVNPGGGGPGCSTPSGDTATVSVFYYDGDGSKTYESWESDSVDPNSVDGLDWVCSGGQLYLRVNYLDDLELRYDVIGSSGDFDPGSVDDPSCGGATGVTRGNKYAFHDRIENCDGTWSLRSTSTWDQHEVEVGYEPTTYSYDGPGGDAPDTEEMGEIVNHYMSALDSEVNLIAKDGPGSSDAINEPASSGELLYETQAGSNFVTFLHVTENEITVKPN